MTRRTRITILGGALAVALAVLYVARTVTRPLRLDAPRPAVVAELTDTLPAPPPSVVEAPVTYDLSAALDSLEAAIPLRYGDIETRHQAGNNQRAHFAFAVSRTPFRVRMEGLTLTLSTTIEYEARGWYRPFIGPEISAACGTGGVPRPRVVATLVSTGRITPQWQVRTRTRIGRLQAFSDSGRDRCRVTPLRIDVTDRVLGATRGLLERGLASIDSGVARWDSRARFEQIWRTLQRPIRFRDSVYMLIAPLGAQLGNVRVSGDTVIAPLRLTAVPRVVTGPYPNEFELFTPIPRLELGGRVGRGARVRLEGTMAWPVGSDLLRVALVGRSVEQSGRRLTIDDVEIFGIGGGRVALGITLGGAVRGRLYFSGTPSLDREHRELHVPDLEVDVGSANLLVRGLEWLKGNDIRDFLRARARFSEADLIDRLRTMAQEGINKPLTDGIELSGTIHRAEATAVHATVERLVVRALAEADLKLAISKAPALPRPPQPPGTR
ncbi:MAG TPA: DUF4403 family protein [Gemmatimonadaceae bacterium]|nr:DUF4403 family protein [Gemmatimonadaceae bacterium]